MSRFPKMNFANKFAAVELRKLGRTHREIANQLGFSHRAVGRALKRYDQTGSFDQEEKGRGRPRLTTKKQDAILEQLCLNARKNSAAEINEEWQKKAKIKASVRTANRRFQSVGLPARTPRRKPLKSEQIREKRLQFALDHLNWTVSDWKKVCFSDETWIQLRENGRLQFVRRRPGEALLPECVVTTTKHPVKVMMFGAVTSSTKSSLEFLKKGKTMDATEYQATLKKVNIKKCLGCGSRKQFQFMEDKAPAHRAKSTQAWHARNGIKVFQGWPGNSPDLNPIENVWSQMKHMQRRERATSIDGIKKIAKKVWRQLSPDYLEKLYESMPRRMQAVADAQGGHTKY